MRLLIMLLLVSPWALAHEMVPTYPELRPSHVDAVSVTSMKLFNKRQDIEYYEVGVFDKDFNPIPFVTSYRIMKVQYLGKVSFDVYIAAKDVKDAEYICSRSKVRSNSDVRAVIASRICSKIK